MKRFPFLTTVFLLSILLIGCNKSNDEDPVLEDSIVGVWNLTDIYTNDGSSTTSGITVNFTAIGKDYDVTVSFGENPNSFASAGNYTTVLTTTLLGNTINQDIPSSEFLENGSWILQGNLLTITTSTGISTVEVLTLNETTLSLKYVVSEDIEVDGIVSAITATYFSTLVR